MHRSIASNHLRVSAHHSPLREALSDNKKQSDPTKFRIAMSALRNKRNGGGGGGDESWMSVVGRIGATATVVMAVAKAVKVVTDSPSLVSMCSKEQDDDSPPTFLKRQILAGTSSVPASSSSWSTTKQFPRTVPELERMSKRYKDECMVAAEEGNYGRVQWLCETQSQLALIIEMRKEFDKAQREGDFEHLPNILSRVTKLQQALSQRLQQETIMLNPGQEANATTDDAILSPIEVERLIASLGNNMYGIDLESPGGITQWRKTNKRKEILVKMQSIYEKMEQSSDEDTLRDLSQQLQVQNDAFTNQMGEKQVLIAPEGKQKQSGFLQKIGETFGFGGTVPSKNEGSTSTKRSSSKRKECPSSLSKYHADVTSDAGPARRRSPRAAQKRPKYTDDGSSCRSSPPKKGNATSISVAGGDIIVLDDCEELSTSTPARNLRSSKRSSFSTSLPTPWKEDVPLTSVGGGDICLEDDLEMSPPTMCGTDIHCYNSDDEREEDDGSIKNTHCQRKEPVAEEESDQENEEHQQDSRSPEPEIQWPDQKDLEWGTFVDFDGQTFYVTDDNENLWQVVRKKVQRDCDFLGDKTAKEILQAMIDANTTKYVEQSLQSAEELNPGILLLVPHPRDWPAKE